MDIRELDGNTFKRIIEGGALGLRLHMKTINDLNVFPVPDGDTGTNMSKTIESGISKIAVFDNAPLGSIADSFAQGTLLGARGNSGVILSQFFAGMCHEFKDKSTVTAKELADAYISGVEWAYRAVSKPVEGTILTVFRESAEYAKNRLSANGNIDELLSLNIEEAERSLKRTKEILPVLTEADVVDSGGAGYLCIAKGMYDALLGKSSVEFSIETDTAEPVQEVNYDLFTTDSPLEFGYCTECLVRLQRAKCDPCDFDDKAFADALEEMGCNSIVALKSGDILKVHAHTMTPGDILALCQKYGEFLNVKIENMSLQHSEKQVQQKTSSVRKRYGVVTVATGDGMTALFESLGADVVINGGQTGNPSAEKFIEAFELLNADNILVLPNNSNILLTATQASQLWGKNNVHVIPTKTVPQGYAALSVFNAATTDIDDQISDLTAAKDAVVSGELTVAIRDSSINGLEIKKGEHIGILDGNLVVSDASQTSAMIDMIEKISDLDDREIITMFVGASVSEEQRVEMTEALEEHFKYHVIEVYIGDQQVYDYLVAVE